MEGPLFSHESRKLGTEKRQAKCDNSNLLDLMDDVS